MNCVYIRMYTATRIVCVCTAILSLLTVVGGYSCTITLVHSFSSALRGLCMKCVELSLRTLFGAHCVSLMSEDNEYYLNSRLHKSAICNIFTI